MKLSICARVSAALGSARPLAPFRTVFRWLASPALPPHAPGRLSEDAADVLAATAEAFAGVPVDRGHYEALFRWRAENLPGHRALYERFAATVNRAASRSCGGNFARCEHGARLNIIQPVFQVRATKSRLGRLRMGLLRRDWVLFDLYIIRPIAVRFAMTDAWRAAGYQSWRGTPRGFDRDSRPRMESLPQDNRA